MSNPINTIPLQQFIQQVKAADLSQQREIKLDIKTAKALADKFRNGTLGANGTLGLERWVQRHLFREVCNVGNTHIRSLSKGRYELTLDPQDGRERARAGGLDLYVIDANSGKTRQVQNLSGGETFLVSLALAL